ncbi:eukaryotic translation initiation factor 2 [Cyanidiococcus yangmingshanensis]|uniref:Eukaryotic translation initiation factor 2 n=1 Tax=Cyanidiococcus yangmingshanensis TaxID=2690220 RepID=A0A7J7IFC5_9RHOD|nr:eukaryotic translation initiation factor 2 [Cyanidiococcus yangmingshanensis]
MKKKKKKKPLELGTSGGDQVQAPVLEGTATPSERQEPTSEQRHVRFQIESDEALAAAQDASSNSALDQGPESNVLAQENHGELSEPWQGTDRDYTYEELLRRIFDMLHGRHPGLGGNVEGRRRLSLRPPQIAREGSKRTVFLNFGEICQSLRRQPEHLAAYMAAELGTTGNMQENARFVLKGRFQPAGFEGVLRRYIREYVMCASCRSPETVLMRDAHTRLYFMKCENCGSSRSVAPIRQGFMAQTERRSLRRDAA